MTVEASEAHERYSKPEFLKPNVSGHRDRGDYPRLFDL